MPTIRVVQQFLADSPWDPAVVVRAVAERVVPAIDVEAWVLDDTGFPKDGKHSPGVKRQYSGTLGKIGNCQIGVSVHAVGSRGTVPLGWALYLPEDWCEDPERRRKAKIPDEVVFKTKPELGVELVERAAGWEIAQAPVLGDCAYGENTELRERLDAAGREYVLVGLPRRHRVRARDDLRGARAAREWKGPAEDPPATGPRTRAIGDADRQPRPEQFNTVTFRDGPDGKPMTSRFCFLRVRAAQRVGEGERPATRGMADRRMARRQRHSRPTTGSPTSPPTPSPNSSPASPACDGRSSSTTSSSKANSASITTKAAHGSAGITTPAGDRRTRIPDPGAAAPKSPAAGLTLPQAIQLFQPLFKCWTGRCQTCQRPVDLNRLRLHPARQPE